MTDVIDRPDLAARWPSVKYARTATRDCGQRIGLAVKFKGSGYLLAFGGVDGLDPLVGRMDAYIAATPYGVNRFGRAWLPR